MKKGILQRVSKNWEETRMAPPPEVKQEPIADYPEPLKPVSVSLEASKGNILSNIKAMQTKAEDPRKKGHRESMISIRKDYSYKYNLKSKTPEGRATPEESPKTPEAPTTSNTFNYSSSTFVQSNRKDASLGSPATSPLAPYPMKRFFTPSKPQISILERYDYDKSKGTSKGPPQPKLLKLDREESPRSAIKQHQSPPHVPILGRSPRSPVEDRLKVIVAQELKSPVAVKQEPDVSLKSPTTPTEQNINKINNKINIIFQLNDNTKSRKNIIVHRRTPKKMVQKITIEEANNNMKQSDEAVPDKVSVDTQTQRFQMPLSTTGPLCDESTEHLFFEDDVLISLQQSTVSFFEFNRLGSLLKSSTDFKLIDRIPRRLHDTLIDPDNKFQRLCYNDNSPLPIYVEMRAKQKELDDPDMCPIAFLYCNVYYIDQRRAKFSSVHLDTVKSYCLDIIYTTVPGTSYFIMAWNELSETKDLVTGIVKYKLTPNLNQLASIRQFPKLNYCTKQMNCGKDSQLITFGDSQVSIFNYESGDLLMSLDLMKSYGINLTTFGFKEKYLFMVYLADDGASSKRVIVIGVNKCDGNTFKVIQSSPIKLKGDKVISKSITSTNHLLVTLSGSVLMMDLNNFRDVHTSQGSSAIFAASNYLLMACDQNVGLCNFTEYFLN